jgi:hypothetical protein
VRRASCISTKSELAIALLDGGGLTDKSKPNGNCEEPAVPEEVSDESPLVEAVFSVFCVSVFCVFLADCVEVTVIVGVTTVGALLREEALTATALPALLMST